MLDSRHANKHNRSERYFQAKRPQRLKPTVRGRPPELERGALKFTRNKSIELKSRTKPSAVLRIRPNDMARMRTRVSTFEHQDLLDGNEIRAPFSLTHKHTNTRTLPHSPNPPTHPRPPTLACFLESPTSLANSNSSTVLEVAISRIT